MVSHGGCDSGYVSQIKPFLPKLLLGKVFHPSSGSPKTHRFQMSELKKLHTHTQRVYGTIRAHLIFDSELKSLWWYARSHCAPAQHVTLVFIVVRPLLVVKNCTQLGTGTDTRAIPANRCCCCRFTFAHSSLLCHYFSVSALYFQDNWLTVQQHAM